jgi:hypothetical protein
VKGRWLAHEAKAEEKRGGGGPLGPRSKWRMEVEGWVPARLVCLNVPWWEHRGRVVSRTLASMAKLANMWEITRGLVTSPSNIPVITERC